MDIKQISVDDFLMGRDKLVPLSDELKANAKLTVIRVNLLLAHFGHWRAVASGYRPDAINRTIKGAAKKSNHRICKACDLEDHDGALDKFCMENQDILAEIGLWLESPASTPGWCHVQTTPPRSGNRVFNP